jgi:hypothetical protein
MGRGEEKAPWRGFCVNLALLLVFACLGTYWLVYEGNGARPTQQTEKLLPFDEGKIEEIILRRAGKTILLTQEQGQWFLKEPAAAPADPQKVKELLSVLDYGLIRRIEERPADYRPYGLAPPALELGIRQRGEKTFRILMIGGNNPDQTSCYARLAGEAPVLLIGGAYKTELMEKDAASFRLLR